MIDRAAIKRKMIIQFAETEYVMEIDGLSSNGDVSVNRYYPDGGIEPADRISTSVDWIMRMFGYRRIEWYILPGEAKVVAEEIWFK